MSIHNINVNFSFKFPTVFTFQRHLLGEKCTGANPSDRAKCGTKRSMVVDGKGVPLGITVDAANRHDMKMTKTTLQSIVVDRPQFCTLNVDRCQ
jgi:DDE family transposase